MKTIPEKGLCKNDVLGDLESFRVKDLDWRSGKVFGFIYDVDEELREVVKESYMMYLVENGLDPTSYPSILRMENEIVAMVGGDLLRGGDKVVGNVTSGGTESIMMTVLAARNRARALHPEITAPEIVMPFTAHAAFYKASHYLGVKIVTVPVKDDSFEADPAAMREAVNDNTILIVCSAPGYAHGVIDPVREIAAIAVDKNILCHVDCCVGGIHLSIMRRMGEPVQDFDFSVPGVTSISVDMHKYGYSAKNCSLILYRSRDVRRYQIFACAKWPGYTIVNPVASSSRTGGPFAAAWAVLNFLGVDGYTRIVSDVMKATRLVIDGINRIPGLKINGNPQMCMFSFISEDPKLNVYRIADEMKIRGWYIQPQFARGNSRSSIHISFTYINVSQAADMLRDLKASVETIRSQPEMKMADFSALASSLQGLDEEGLLDMLEMIGASGGNMPDRMEPVNRLLESLPDDLEEFIISSFFNTMQKAQ